MSGAADQRRRGPRPGYSAAFSECVDEPPDAAIRAADEALGSGRGVLSRDHWAQPEMVVGVWCVEMTWDRCCGTSATWVSGKPTRSSWDVIRSRLDLSPAVDDIRLSANAQRESPPYCR